MQQQRANGTNSSAADAKPSVSDSGAETAGRVLGVTNPISWDLPSQNDIKLTNELDGMLKQCGLYESEEELNLRYANFCRNLNISGLATLRPPFTIFPCARLNASSVTCEDSTVSYTLIRQCISNETRTF